MSFDPFDPEVIENPFPFFEWLRREAPVYQLPNKAYYLVSRYEDVMSVVMDTETFSSNLVAVLQADSQGQELQLLDFAGAAPKARDVLAVADAPQHTRQRRISNRAFTRRRVATMEAEIRALTDTLIDHWIDQHEADWVTELAVPLPMTIIIKLLGLPLEDMPKLKRWSDSSVALLSGINSQQQLMAYSTDIAEMFAYLAHHIELASQSPSDNVIGDLVRESQVNEEFGLDEMTSILVQLLTAGNETTASLIGSGLMRLLQEPALQEELRANPERIDAFVEETLRLESPFYGHFRVVTKATELAGTRLEKGDRLMLLWSSANRDASQYSKPDSVDLTRDRAKSHLAFGYGIHHCIGASLARLEARIAFERILARTQSLELSESNSYRHIPSLFIRSLESLRIHFRAA